jgi:Holliday junction resolvase RusA-like endonuclease
MATLKIRLTKQSVEALLPPSVGTAVVWDADLPGFGVWVQPTGLRTYFIYARMPGGKQIRRKIGRADRITAAQARDVARKWLARIELGETLLPRSAPKQPSAPRMIPSLKFVSPMPQPKAKTKWLNGSARRQCVVDALHAAYPDLQPEIGAVTVHMTALCPPASTACDVDNLMKPVLDALAGHVYVNDTQVVECLARKVSSKKRQLIIQVWIE